MTKRRTLSDVFAQYGMGGPGGGPGKVAPVPGASGLYSDRYLRNLRVLQSSLRATASGLINPALLTSTADILSKHGMDTDELGKALAGGALTISYNEANVLSGPLAQQLSDLQTAVDSARSSLRRPTSTGGQVLEGAAQGAAAGAAAGPYGIAIGAVAGAVGGLIGARSSSSVHSTAKRTLQAAGRLAGPENLAANVDRVTAAAREQSIVAGQQAALSEQAQVSKSGLTGTGVGAQASIAASAVPQIAALRAAVGTGASTQANEVAFRLGQKPLPPNPTAANVIGGLAGVAGALLSPEEIARRKKAKLDTQAGYTDPFNPPATSTTINQPTYGEPI